MQMIDRIVYGGELVRHIARRVKRVRGWSVNVEAMTGCIYLAHPGAAFCIYATPLWDDAEHDLDIQLDDNDGDFQNFPVHVAWTGDLDADCARWTHIVATVIGTVQAGRALAAHA